MPHGRNVVCVLYRLVAGRAVRLHTRPYAVFRRQDAPLVVAPAPFRLTIEGGRHELALAESPLALRFPARPVRSTASFTIAGAGTLSKCRTW